MKTKDSQKSSSSEEEDGMESEQELMQTSENLQKVAQEKEASKSLGWRWKEGGVLLLLLIVYIVCNMTLSLIAPFFPGRVREQNKVH